MGSAIRRKWLSIGRLVGYHIQMRARLFFAAIVATMVSCPAHAQLIDQRTDGLARVCEYQPRLGQTKVVTRRVGLGDPCPAQAPLVDSGRPPAAAGLTSDVVTNDDRICIYAQGGERWTVKLLASERCPLSAGMIAVDRAASGNPSRPFG